METEMFNADLTSLTALERVRRISEGLPYTELDRVIARISPHDRSLRYSIASKATLARRKREMRLSGEESAKLVRMNEIMQEAAVVWKSDDSARAFLFRPHPLLEMLTPIDVAMMNEFGADLVRDILMKLAYGTGV
jgi:putative toxin-antitoxin system antitoxin component (TIGR02293 family)